MSARNYRYQSKTKLESRIPVSGLEGITLFSGEIFLGARRNAERGDVERGRLSFAGEHRRFESL